MSFKCAGITFILCCLILLSSTNSFAQYEIKGIVKDSANAIEFANIILQDNNGKVVRGSVTDESGSFLLNASEGQYKLLVSFIGYEDFSQAIDLSSDVQIEDIIMTQNASQLAAIVVTGKKKLVERKMDKLFFYVENSHMKDGYDGIEVLKRAPSVYIDGFDRILLKNEAATVLINGRKLNLLGAELVNYIKGLESKNIKRIEVQAAGTSAADADIQGGIINIILDRSDSGFSANLKADYKQIGSNSGYSSAANLNYGGPKWNVYSTLFYMKKKDNGNSINSTTFNFTNKRYHERQDFFEDFKYLSANAGATFKISDRQDLGYEFYTTFSRYAVNNESIQDVFTDGQFLDSGQTLSNRNSDPNYYNSSFNYSIVLDTTGGKLSFLADYATQDLDNNFGVHSLFDQNNIDDLKDRGTTKAKTKIISAQLDYNKTLPQLGSLAAGVKFVSTQRDNKTIYESFIDSSFIVDNNRSSFFDFEEKIYASYASLTKSFPKQIDVKVGLRIENTNLRGVNSIDGKKVAQDYFNFFPSLYIAKTFPNDNYISFNYARRINRPSFSILNPDNSKTNAFNLYIGNPDLKPEYRNNFILSFEIGREHAFSAYYYLINNKLAGVFTLEDEAITVHQYMNIGKAETFGLEYDFSQSIKKWWFLKYGASVYQQRFELPNRVAQRNTFATNITSDWTLPKEWFLSLSGGYNTSDVDGNFVNADLLFTNLMVQKSLLDNSLKIRFYLNDIFDTKRTKSEGIFDPFSLDFYQKKNTRQYTIWMQYTIASKKGVRNKRINSSNDAKYRL